MMYKSMKMVAAVGAAAVVVGCATAKAPQPVSKYDKTGKGEVFAVVVFNSRVSGEATCEAARESNPALNDPRCKKPSDYYGVLATPQFGAWVSDAFPVLIPNSVEVSGNYIIKAQLVEGEPAHFQFVATAKQSKDSDCYNLGSLGPATGGSGGVVCPKYNWDYRNYVPNP